MKRILHIRESMDAGGIGSFIMNIYRHLDRGKIQFDFLLLEKKESYFHGPEILSLGGKIYNCITPRRKNLIRYELDLYSFFKSHPEYDTVHIHTGIGYKLSAMRWAKYCGVKMIILHAHSAEKPKTLSARLRKSLNKYTQRYFANTFLTCSDLAADNIYGTTISESDIAFVPNAVNSDSFVFNEEKRRFWRNEFNLHGKFVVGNIGRFTYPKNHDFLLDIFNEVSKINTQAVLLLVGDGVLRPALEEKIQRLGCEDRVILTGLRSDVSDLLQAIDVFVMPSHYEGLPVTVVEAQAAGVQCILSDVITKQVRVSDLVEYVSLEMPAHSWATQILKYDSGYQRRNMKPAIIESGFDTKEVIRLLEGYYLADLSKTAIRGANR